MNVKLLVLILSAFASVAGAQDWEYFARTGIQPASAAITSNTVGHIGILVKFVGAAASGAVACDAGTGDLTFTVGASGSEAADTTFECPVSGAGGGVIDVSDTACNTMGEVVDSINSSANWRAVIVDGIRADVSTNTLTTFAATAATAAAGLPLYKDGAVDFLATYCLNCPRTIGPYLNTTGVSPSFVPNPFKGREAAFIYGNATSTYSSGTSAFSVLSSAVVNRSGGTAGVGNPGTDTVTTIIGGVAGGASTTQAVFDFRPFGLVCRKDERCLVRLTNSAVMSAINLYAFGVSFPATP